jgi:putative tryptophan/tyrosine transport system substrate-binding protein
VISRRAFVGALIGGSVTAPMAAHAQQTGRVSKIGILANFRGGVPDLWGAFIEGLKELGYVEGRNMAIEWRVSEGKYERLPVLAVELVRAKPDVIVVPANQNAVAAQQATRTIPIVMIGVTDPVGNGFVRSLARPGGNMTGLTGSVSPTIAGKQMELLKAAVSTVTRVAILGNPGNTAYSAFVREANNVARSLKIQAQVLEARGPDEFAPAFTAMSKERAGALLIIGDGMLTLHQAKLADLVMKSRLPTIGPNNLITSGVLMSYQTSSPDLWRRGATYVDKILKGANPGELPVEQPTKFDLVINLKTAKALGLTIPTPLLARADEIIRQ